MRAAEPLLPVFVDISQGSGVDFVSQPSETTQKYLPTTMLGGVAMLDYDGDGRLDLFFVNGARVADPMPKDAKPDKSDPRYWDRLYRNEGGGRFADVTEKAGLRGSFYGQGVAVGDYDNDGDADLYVTGIERNALYRNDGGGRFREVSEQAGVAGGGWSTSAAFFDYDSDGLLDLVVARYLHWSFAHNPYCGDRAAQRRSYCHPDEFEALPALLYRNRGDGTFEDVSERSGLAASAHKGLGVALNDYDSDGRIDVFFANDSWPQHLFRNGRAGFSEEGLALGVAYDEDGREFAGMGADLQDYDNDGRPDLFVNALARQGYHLYRNQGDAFAEVSVAAGLAEPTQLSSGWGATFVDFGQRRLERPVCGAGARDGQHRGDAAGPALIANR
ncbi:MAG: VCBS repeat-containing protein [Bryobacterales bacterium]